jgi:rare lipoprotein A
MTAAGRVRPIAAAALLGAAASSLLLLSGCRPRPRALPPAAVQIGIASWYGGEFHGRTTSNGEVYDMHDLTAAHRTLPFGTLVEVTNLQNGRTVTVRINDRGPFVKGRIIDLSLAAARLLDLVGPGTAPVSLEVVREAVLPPGAARFSLQLGAFTVRENAERLAAELRRDFPEVAIEMLQTPAQVYFRVRIPARTPEQARDLALRLSARGYDVLLLEGR